MFHSFKLNWMFTINNIIGIKEGWKECTSGMGQPRISNLYPLQQHYNIYLLCATSASNLTNYKKKKIKKRLEKKYI